ncbi:magnesium-transporting ATPase (P-type) [Aurantimicrobium minutum]|uniref:hypothetical protein n=1 Tax=Aurantimicrobium minutum TaxID=708131 RepID=UPI002476C781|nr:hypothetical protein [Aurantimicrobium minutum]MDH6278453.1 magnesium-transporting ATPase (P-type) [Aurantimicrobium minutum]
MLTKRRVNSSAIPVLLGIIAIIFGIEFLVFQSPNISIPAIILGVILLTLSFVVKRKSSTPFERILMLNPRDEREAKQIEWGFSLVGKLTLALIFAIFASILFYSGYVWYSDDFGFSDCFKPHGSSDLVCSPTALYYYSYSSVYVLAIFGVIAILSSVIAVTRKVK